MKLAVQDLILVTFAATTTFSGVVSTLRWIDDLTSKISRPCAKH
jgi:hypothetical protein